MPPQNKCFIIGGGESLVALSKKGLNIPKLIQNEITIGTNKSYMYGKSTYHVVMDLPYFNTDQDNLLKQNLYVSDQIFSNRVDLQPQLNLLKRLRTPPKIISDSIEEGLYYGKSSGYLAMNLANALGLNPIYLMGIDLVGGHFHEGYGKEKDLRLPKEHKVIENEFRQGIRFLQNKGVEIISLSDISRLNDIIPYNLSVLKSYEWDVYKKMWEHIGVDWTDPDINQKLQKIGLDPLHKYRNREEWITIKKKLISQLLTEYEYNIKPKSVLDFSIGNGAFLEVMRYLGHRIHGTDAPTCKYIPFHESQEIPVTYFNASEPPYPFKDKSYDLVSSVSAMNFYKCDWNKVLDEFFRIARETVFVLVNLGTDWEEKKHFIDNYVPPKGWKIQYNFKSTFKWVYGD